MTTTQLFQNHNNNIAIKMMEDVKIEETAKRLEAFNKWMEKIQNPARFDFKKMCHARARLVANFKI